MQLPQQHHPLESSVILLPETRQDIGFLNLKTFPSVWTADYVIDRLPVSMATHRDGSLCLRFALWWTWIPYYFFSLCVWQANRVISSASFSKQVGVTEWLWYKWASPRARPCMASLQKEGNRESLLLSIWCQGYFFSHEDSLIWSIYIHPQWVGFIQFSRSFSHLRPPISVEAGIRSFCI